MRAEASRSFVRFAAAATLVLVLPMGCLPRGPAPTGQRLLTDGAADQLLFLPRPDGQPAGLFIQRSSQNGALYAVDPPSANQALGTERLLIDHVASITTLCAAASCAPALDSRGRLFVYRYLEVADGSVPGGVSDISSLVRVDPMTGETVDFGQRSFLGGISPDGSTIALDVGGTPLTLRDVDDREVRIDDAMPGSGQFVGGDFYFTTADHGLWRLRPPFVAREMLARDVSSFEVLGTGDPLLVLCRAATLGAPCENALLDPATAVETALPPVTAKSSGFSISPSGRYLFGTAPPDLSMYPDPYTPPPPTLAIYDLSTGTEETTMDFGDPTQRLGQGSWRPGHDEVWFDTQPLSYQPPLVYGFWRWQPGQRPVQVAAESPFYWSNYAFSSGAFTPDGRLWLSTVDGPTSNKSPIVLRTADDPAAEPLLVNPTGTGVGSVWLLGDGRLIVEDWITNYQRADLYLVDPVARTLSPRGQSGHVVAVGATRILVLLEWIAGGGGSGSLTLVDLETGSATLLAENVHAVAIDTPSTAGGDRLAAGTQVAYLSRNRIASPYDGLWLTTLP